MALNKAALKTDLQTLFTSPPATRALCADAWAAAYASYAAAGRSCQNVGGVLTGRQAALSSALNTAFGNSNAASTATAMDTAFCAFWNGVVFPPGVTAGTAAVSPGTLTASLPAMWLANVAGALSASAAAQAHADKLDLFTKTVIVTHVAPSACAAPLL